MMKAKTLAAIAAGMVLVSSCGISSEVEALKKMPPKGDAYMDTLKMEYAALAGAADERGSSSSAEMFYEKGKMAAEGKKVEPMGMKDRKLPKGVDDEIEAGRIALIAVMRGGGSKKAPKEMAAAVVSFDCWMDEAAKEAPAGNVVKACRDKFDKALKFTEDALSR